MSKLSPDEKWKRFNKKLEEQMKVNDFFGLGTTYYEMAKFLDSEGKNSNHLRNFGYEMKLKVLMEDLKKHQENSDVVKKLEILCADDSCNECKAFGSKKVQTNKEIENPTLPVRECVHKYGCRCTYLPTV